MIKHVFKLMWNRKKSYLGIFLEQMIITIVLMFCMVKSAQTIQKYADPGLMDTRNTIVFGINPGKTAISDTSFIPQANRVLENKMRKLPYVKAITRSYGFMPYMQQSKLTDSVQIDDRKIRTEIKGADEYTQAVFRPVMQEGVWLKEEALADGTYPAVITKPFADKAGWSYSSGKKIKYDTHVYTVTGVMRGLKQEVLEPSVTAIILPLSHLKNEYEHPAIARTKNNRKDDFANALYKECKILYPDYTPIILSGDMLKQAQVLNNAAMLILMTVAVLFLTVFAFAGTFGVFNLHAKRHLREFALRMAIGATTGKIRFLLIFESLLVTCLAMLPAMLLSFMIYDYKSGADLTAIPTTVSLMLLFSLISAWYPAWKVSRVNPAEALQYE
jgi:ABC-type antimicrobial peptide transport system permease subunit